MVRTLKMKTIISSRRANRHAKIQPPETKISLILFNVQFSSNVGWLWVHERRPYSVIVPQRKERSGEEESVSETVQRSKMKVH